MVIKSHHGELHGTIKSITWGHLTKSGVWVRWLLRKFPWKRHFNWDIKPWYSKCGPQMVCLRITRELIRNADSPVPLQTYTVGLYILIRSPGDLCVHLSLKSANIKLRKELRWEGSKDWSVLGRGNCAPKDCPVGMLPAWKEGWSCGGWESAVSWQPGEEQLERTGASTLLRSREQLEMCDDFSRDFWLPFGELFWWSNTGQDSRKKIEQWVAGKEWTKEAARIEYPFIQYICWASVI